MTEQEYQYWSNITANSKYYWQIDAITLRNQGVYLIYKGGEDGIFIEVQRNGTVIAGEYQGAIPHINESIFYTKGKRSFKNQNEALTYVIERLGLQFLIDSFGNGGIR